MYEVECPYCGHDQEEDLEGSQYEEDHQSETECEECEKTFVFFTHISISLSSQKADCLNGEPHKYEPTNCYPVHSHSVRLCRCSDCYEEKQFNIEELKELNIEYKDKWKKFDEEVLSA